MERAADVEEGYMQTAPLVFHFGHKSPADNITLFNILTSRLAEVINVRSEQSHRGPSMVSCFIHLFILNKII